MRWLALLMTFTALAGCADQAEPPVDDDEAIFEGEDVAVSETTGAIRGVVVNEAIEPVQGATVTAMSTSLSDATDEQGRFTFSGLSPGTYFLEITHPLHDRVQQSVDVVAGVAQPPIVKVQMQRLYLGDPFVVTAASSGFFTCSQAAMPPYLYSSSSCHDQGVVDGSDLGVELEQQRTFHADVQDGWQTQLFEMQWEPSAQGTSDQMGIVVSTDKETREGAHWFADFESTSPLYGRMDCCDAHPSHGTAEPIAIPPEGWSQMSYFMSVRPPADAQCFVWCLAPGLAIDQSFEVWLTQAYYQPLPEGWSFMNGDAPPF